MSENSPSKHMSIMVIAHLAPLLLFLILPKFGVSIQWAIAFAALSMVVAHIWMMRGHSHNHSSHTMKKGDANGT